jgi:hypothetical protein
MNKEAIKQVRFTPEQMKGLERAKEKYRQETLSSTIRMIIDDFISQEQQRSAAEKLYHPS